MLTSIPSSLLVFLFSMLKSSGFGAYTIDSKKGLIFLYYFCSITNNTFLHAGGSRKPGMVQKLFGGFEPFFRAGQDRLQLMLTKICSILSAKTYFLKNSFFVRSK